MSQTGEMGRIFISYRREDSAYATGWLYDRLRDKFGVTQIFKDVDSLEPGDDFVDKITDAVTSCAVLLAVIGPDWLRIADEQGRPRLHDPDDFVRLELEVALSRQVRVIPLLVEGAKMPKATDLPQDLVPLLRRHALELTSAHFNRDADDLVEVLERAVATPPPKTPMATYEPPTPRPKPAAPVVVDEAPEAVPLYRPLVEPPAPQPQTRASTPTTVAWHDPSPPQPTSTSPSPRPRRRVLGRTRRRLGLLALVVAVLAGLVCGAIYLSLPVPRSVLALSEDALLWPRWEGKVRQIAVVNRQQSNSAKIRTQGDDRGVVISRDRRTFLYLHVKDRGYELRAKAARGSRDRLLFADHTPQCQGLHRPAWRDDTLAVVCDDKPGSRFGSLRLMSLDGRVKDVLDQGVLGQPTFCAGGRTVVYWRNDRRPAPSSDGGALWEAAVDRSSPPQRLTNGRSDVDPACSPDGDHVVFRRAVDKKPSLFRIRSGQKLQERPALLLVSDQAAQDPAWSPDGKQISFRQGTGDNTDLWVMKADGSSATGLFRTVGNDGAPAWASR